MPKYLTDGSLNFICKTIAEKAEIEKKISQVSKTPAGHVLQNSAWSRTYGDELEFSYKWQLISSGDLESAGLDAAETFSAALESLHKLGL